MSIEQYVPVERVCAASAGASKQPMYVGRWLFSTVLPSRKLFSYVETIFLIFYLCHFVSVLSAARASAYLTESAISAISSVKSNLSH